MPIDVGKNVIRIRIAMSSEFQEDTYRIIIIGQSSRGIRVLAGRKKGERKLSIQSFLFDKNKWTVSEARKWVKDHGYTIKGEPMKDEKNHLCSLPLTKLIEPATTPITVTSVFGYEPPEHPWELIIEAMASTPTVDRGNEVVPPTAFARTMGEFMQNQPVMMFNHMSDWTIGKVLEYKIDENGLWIKGGIAPTDRGKEVATLIRYGVVSAMSFRYDVVDSERGEDGEPTVLRELNVYEIGPVSIPMNPEAVIEQAKQKGIQLKSLTVPSEAGGATNAEGDQTMDAKDIQKVVDSSVAPAIEGVKKNETQLGEHEATIKDVQKRVDSVVAIQKTLEEAKADGTKTSGDLRELIDNVSGDLKKNVEALTAEINQVKNRKRISTLEPMGTSLKTLISMEPKEVERLYPNQAPLVAEMQKSVDRMLILDALRLAASRNGDDDYHQTPMAKRLQGFNEFRKFTEFAKALDTATATEGTEWVPTDLSGTLKELIRVELKVAGLFEELQMPTKSYEVPIETADVLATLQGETTAVVSAFDSTEQTPTTGKCTLTASKARARIQVSSELTEDSVFPVIPWIQRQASRAIARSIDRAIINGDNAVTHFDTGYTVASTDFRRAWDGLRYHYNTTIKGTLGVDLGALTEDLLREIRQNMGKHGMYPNDLAWISSIKGYLGGFVRKLDQLQTLDKYGPNAVILSGEVSKMDGIPNIVTEFIDDTLDADGLYTGSGNALSQILLVNRMGWVRGNHRDVTVAVVQDQINDVFTVVAFKRCDFKPFWTISTSEVAVNSGHGLAF